ncbi:hypothetical protein B0J11DRAFT_395196, partial [Dendryphion nanum]
SDEAFNANPEPTKPRPRKDFETLSKIPDRAFKKLLVSHLNFEINEDKDCRILTRTKGASHLCVILSITLCGDFVIKVPARASTWRKEDAWNLRSEVGTMKFVRKETSIPVPRVYAWDDRNNNVIQAPYIIMEFIDNPGAHTLWFPTRKGGLGFTYKGCNEPSPALEAKRQTFLKSLASLMAQLSAIEFHKIGYLNFDDPKARPRVTHYYEDKDDVPTRVPAFSTSKKYWTHIAQYLHSNLMRSGKSYDLHRSYNTGMLLFLTQIFATPPLDTSKAHPFTYTETFTLTHTDLNLQNILVDASTGAIAGIIDWDRCGTKPRPIGPTSVPLFLQEDWLYWVDWDYFQSKPRLEYYRNCYAKYMMEATWSEKNGVGDGILTLKSAIYHAALEAL